MAVENFLKSGGSVDLTQTEALVENLEDAVGVYNLTPPVEYFVTFSSPSSFSLSTVNSSKNWDGTLEYSTDKTNWDTWQGTSVISSGTNNKLYLRGINNTYMVGSDDANKKWVFTGSNISAQGNIENLLDYATVEGGNHPTMGSHCFHRLFQGTPLSDVSNLIFGATRLSQYCYARMFYGSAIQGATPQLPAETLADYCYYSMFYNCRNLTTPCKLPARFLSQYCYAYMFGNCVSLSKLVTFPYINNFPGWCCGLMYAGCSLIKLSATQGGEYVNAYSIKGGGDGTYAFRDMFSSTGGTYTGTIYRGTTYYTSNEIIDSTEA